MAFEENCCGCCHPTRFVILDLPWIGCVWVADSLTDGTTGDR
ncbi:hypothetical protein [Streptomyces sp. NPDC058297]